MLIAKLTQRETRSFRTSMAFRERMRAQARSKASKMGERKIRVVDPLGQLIEQFFLHVPEHTRRSRRSRRPARASRRTGRRADSRPAGQVDEHAKTDLDLFIENTRELQNQKQSILANVRRRRKKGTYDPQIAPKLWMYWVDAGARQYMREFKMHGSIDTAFNKATREALAKELAKRYASGEDE